MEVTLDAIPGELGPAALRAEGTWASSAITVVVLPWGREKVAQLNLQGFLMSQRGRWSTSENFPKGLSYPTNGNVLSTCHGNRLHLHLESLLAASRGYSESALGAGLDHFSTCLVSSFGLS